MTRRLRVLLSAYACEPGKGSEPAVGWNVAMAVARDHDVWVLTRANNRAPIEKALSENRHRSLEFVFYDLPAWAAFWKRGQRGVQLYYYLWQLGAYRLARKLHRRVLFDLVQHVTFVKYWSPSLMGRLSIPFVWGPIGGGDSTPAALRSELTIRGRLSEALRDLACWLGERDPLVRDTARKSTVALATTQGTAAAVKALGAGNVVVLSQVGLSPEDLRLLDVPCRPAGGPFRLISVGRLLQLKGFAIGIKAFAASDLDSAEYWIVGDGPDRARLDALAARLGVRDQVRFLGSLSRAETLERLVQCDVLVHPSLHDSGSWVCAEAMAARRPVICLDWAGPGHIVPATAGIKVSPRNSQQVVAEARDGMRLLAESPQLRLGMGSHGRDHVEKHLSWQERGAELSRLYASLVGSTIQERSDDQRAVRRS